MTILDKPFPFVEEVRHKLITSFGFSFFVFLFLFVFKPFGLAQQESGLLSVVAGFGLITLLVTLTAYFVFPMAFPRFFDRDQWTVKKMLLFAVFQFGSISIFNWLYSTMSCGTPLDLMSFLDFLYITLAVGVIPSAFEVILMERYLSNQHEQVANELTEQIVHSDRNQSHTIISMKSDTGKIEIEVEEDDLVCVKAEGNYTKVFYEDHGNIKFHLLRNSLSTVAGYFDNQERIMQCHRSYIVNFNKVEKVSGNARNYNLHIPELDFTIPVSRSFSKEIIKKIQDGAHR